MHCASLSVLILLLRAKPSQTARAARRRALWVGRQGVHLESLGVAVKAGLRRATRAPLGAGLGAACAVYVACGGVGSLKAQRRG